MLSSLILQPLPQTTHRFWAKLKTSPVSNGGGSLLPQWWQCQCCHLSRFKGGLETLHQAQPDAVLLEIIVTRELFVHLHSFSYVAELLLE